MPLRKGSSYRVISANIAELLRSWRETGRIGNSRPKTFEEAHRQAIAIALDYAGRSNKRSSATAQAIKNRRRRRKTRTKKKRRRRR